MMIESIVVSHMLLDLERDFLYHCLIGWLFALRLMPLIEVKYVV